MSEEKEEDDLQPGGGLARVWVEKGSWRLGDAVVEKREKREDEMEARD